MAQRISRADNALSLSIKINDALAQIKGAALGHDEAIDFRGSPYIASSKINRFMSTYAAGLNVGPLWAMTPEEFVEAINIIPEYADAGGWVPPIISQRYMVAMVGDSVTAGYGAGVEMGTGEGVNAGSSGNYLRANSTPSQISDMLQALGVPSRSDAIFGTGNPSPNTLAEFLNADPGHTFGAAWSAYDGSSLGGRAFNSANTGTSSWVTKSWDYDADTFEIYYFTLSSFGTFTITDASGTLATINTTIVSLPPGAGAGGFGKTTVTRAQASTLPISIQRNGTGGAVYVQGIVPYDSASPRVEIWNMGWAGSTSSSWNVQASNGWKAYYALGLVEQPDLWYLELGLNDMNTAVSAATYQTNLNALSARMKVGGGSLIIGKTNRPYLNNASWLMSASHLSAIDTVAAANSASIIDHFDGVSLVQADYFDIPHLTKSGYAKKASKIKDAILEALV